MSFSLRGLWSKQFFVCCAQSLSSALIVLCFVLSVIINFHHGLLPTSCMSLCLIHVICLLFFLLFVLLYEQDECSHDFLVSSSSFSHGRVGYERLDRLIGQVQSQLFIVITQLIMVYVGCCVCFYYFLLFFSSDFLFSIIVDLFFFFPFYLYTCDIVILMLQLLSLHTFYFNIKPDDLFVNVHAHTLFGYVTYHVMSSKDIATEIMKTMITTWINFLMFILFHLETKFHILKT